MSNDLTTERSIVVAALSDLVQQRQGDDLGELLDELAAVLRRGRAIMRRARLAQKANADDAAPGKSVERDAATTTQPQPTTTAPTTRPGVEHPAPAAPAPAQGGIGALPRPRAAGGLGSRAGRVLAVVLAVLAVLALVGLVALLALSGPLGGELAAQWSVLTVVGERSAGLVP